MDFWDLESEKGWSAELDLLGRCRLRCGMFVIMNQCFPVLVHSGCCNKIPQTGWLTNNRDLFLRVLEAGSPWSGWQHGSVLGELFSELQMASFELCVLTWWEGPGISGASFMGQYPIHVGPTLMNKTPPRGPTFTFGG